MRFACLTRSSALCSLLISAFTLGLGCSQSEISSLDADNGVRLEAAMGEPAGNEMAAIEVPDGTPAELFAFMEQLDGELQLAIAPDPTETETLSDDQRAIAIRRVMQARVAACDKILSGKIDESTRLQAVRTALNAWRTLVAMDPDGMTAPYEEFIHDLISGGDPQLGRLAKAANFQVAVNRSLSSETLPADALLGQLRELLSDPDAGVDTFVASREGVSWMLQAGHLATGTQALRMIGRHFQQHANAEVANEAKTLIDESYKLDLTQLARQAAEGNTGALETLQQNIQELLSVDANDADALGFALQTAQLLEYAGNFAEALTVYQGILRAYPDTSQSDLAREVQHSVGLAQRRLSLIGEPIQIEGARINGASFDWSEYRGRWTLVCFWTTWHRGWLDEAQNVRRVLAKHPAAEIDVVAISLDDDRNRVERYLKEHPTSWPVLINPDATALGFENPNAIRCGVEAVPFILLVDPLGKVVDIHLLGERLESSLDHYLAK